jgi:hypothetical protein
VLCRWNRQSIMRWSAISSSSNNDMAGGVR